jgi:hypothetical protein
VRRPSPALAIALLALFVALGGPAQARRLIDGKEIRKGTVRSRQIKDHSLATRDLSRAAVRSLRQTPNGSVSSAKLGDGAVIAGKLGPGAVTGAAVADGSLTGADILDGTLTTQDVTRYAGRFRVVGTDIGTIQPHTCWHGEPHGLAPELAGADISNDAVFIAPRAGFEERSTAFSWRTSGPSATDPASASRFVIALCNVTDAAYTPPDTGIAFSYLVFDIP